MDIMPAVSTRSVVVGTTGSGKTMLMQKLAEQAYERQPVVILDPKSRWEIPPYGEVWYGPKESPPESAYIVYRPRFGANIPAECDEIARMVYEQGDTYVGIDEVVPILGSDTVNGPRGIKFLYCLGRGLGITVVAGIQRPAGAPIYFFSECEHAYVFKMRNKDDRKRVSDYFGEELRGDILTEDQKREIIKTMGTDPKHRKYWFRFANDEDGVYERALRLDLSDKK